MSTTTLSVNIDQETKKQAEVLFRKLGLNMSVAINIFIRQAIRKNGIPFELSANEDPFFNEVNTRRLMSAKAQIEAGKGTIHELIEVDDE